MNTIAILPNTPEGKPAGFVAVSGDGTAVGRTPGEALDALAHQTDSAFSAGLVIEQNFQSDEFFDEAKRTRLSQLMNRWREARDSNNKLDIEEMNELDRLVNEELEAATTRANSVLDSLETQHSSGPDLSRLSRLSREAETDVLTGLPNRRYLKQRLALEINRSNRDEQPLSLLMVDIDDFNLYNDRNGHDAGDLALAVIAQSLTSVSRSEDVVTRYAGEAFCVLLTQTSSNEAIVIAERMRKQIEERTPLTDRAGGVTRLTISIGISTLDLTVNSAERMMSIADFALYVAKRSGKNKTVSFQDYEDVKNKSGKGPDDEPSTVVAQRPGSL